MYPSRRAKYMPRRTDNLRPGFDTLIGRVFSFDYAGTGDEDDTYPLQSRWIFSRVHDAELGEDMAAKWVPDEDLVDAE